MKRVCFSTAKLAKHFCVPLLFVALISFTGIAYPNNGGFSEFLDKTVGAVEKQQPQKSENQSLPNQNNQSADTIWNPPQNNSGYYDDKNTSPPPNNPPPQNNSGFNNNRSSPATNQFPASSPSHVNSSENNSSTYNGTFSQRTPEDNSVSDTEKSGGINANIPAGVSRFRSQRDQNIYLDGIQDYEDGLVDRDGKPIEQSRIGKVQKPAPDHTKTYNQKHKRK